MSSQQQFVPLCLKYPCYLNARVGTSIPQVIFDQDPGKLQRRVFPWFLKTPLLKVGGAESR